MKLVAPPASRSSFAVEEPDNVGAAGIMAPKNRVTTLALSIALEGDPSASGGERTIGKTFTGRTLSLRRPNTTQQAHSDGPGGCNLAFGLGT